MPGTHYNDIYDYVDVPSNEFVDQQGHVSNCVQISKVKRVEDSLGDFLGYEQATEVSSLLESPMQSPATIMAAYTKFKLTPLRTYKERLCSLINSEMCETLDLSDIELAKTLSSLQLFHFIDELAKAISKMYEFGGVTETQMNTLQDYCDTTKQFCNFICRKNEISITETTDDLVRKGLMSRIKLTNAIWAFDDKDVNSDYFTRMCTCHKYLEAAVDALMNSNENLPSQKQGTVTVNSQIQKWRQPIESSLQEQIAIISRLRQMWSVKLADIRSYENKMKNVRNVTTSACLLYMSDIKSLVKCWEEHMTGCISLAQELLDEIDEMIRKLPEQADLFSHLKHCLKTKGPRNQVMKWVEFANYVLDPTTQSKSSANDQM